MNLKLLYVQSGKEKWLDIAQELYLKKVNHFYPFKIELIKTKPLARLNKNEKIKIEKELILKKINKNDFLIIFDEKGKAPASSVSFSKELQFILESGKQSIVFLIGGSYGFSDEIKEIAKKTYSFSHLTFNHHVAQLVALEQIYRALCIQKNIPYHNE